MLNSQSYGKEKISDCELIIWIIVSINKIRVKTPVREKTYRTVAIVSSIFD